MAVKAELLHADGKLHYSFKKEQLAPLSYKAAAFFDIVWGKHQSSLKKPFKLSCNCLNFFRGVSG